MAPGYRANTQTRRGNRGAYPEHDDFEGLPVRQWREEWVYVAPPAAPETTQVNDKWAVELPHGMPKDYHLLAPHSQELLRAARSGRLYKRPAPAEEDENELEAADKAAKKQATNVNGIKVKTWKQVPRNAEDSTISYLAKRHKNTVTLTSKAALSQAAGPTVTRATVRRIDAAGNPYEQTVTLANGERVDGEIIATSVIPMPTAAEAGNGLVQQVTPNRRRPPPPKRKKGPGRGRKKGKLPLPPTSNPAPVAGGAGEVPPGSVADPGATREIKLEGETGFGANNDSEVADNSAQPSDEDGDEDGDDGDDADEGDDGEGSRNDGDEQDSPTPNREGEDEDPMGRSQPGDDQLHEADESGDMDTTEDSTLPPETSGLDSEMGEASQLAEDGGFSARRNFQPANPLNLAPPHPAMHLLASPRHEGSPLKNVVLLSPTEPSPNMSPIVGTLSAAAPVPGSHGALSTEFRPSGEVAMTDAYEQAHHSSATEPTADGNTASDTDRAAGSAEASAGDVPATQEMERTEAYALPTAHEMETSLQDASTNDQPEPTSAPRSSTGAVFSLPNLRDLPEVDDSVPLEVAEEQFLDDAALPERADEGQAAGTGDDEGSLDLLGGLERELERQGDFDMDKSAGEAERAETVGGQPKTEEGSAAEAAAAADESAGLEEPAPGDGSVS